MKSAASVTLGAKILGVEVDPVSRGLQEDPILHGFGDKCIAAFLSTQGLSFMRQTAATPPFAIAWKSSSAS